MFEVDGNFFDIKKQVSHRDLGYGRNDLKDRAKNFVWTESLDLFMEVCEIDIDGFIEQCRIDDRNQIEPDIDFLYRLNYPDSRKLLKEDSTLFCELLYQYPIMLVSYFDKNPNALSGSGFSINNIDSVVVKDDFIIIKGLGYYY